MSDLPYGAKGDIEIELVIRGPAELVLAELRRLREDGLRRSAAVSVLAYSALDRRRREITMLPRIHDGDAAAAKQKIDQLARQRLLPEEIERRLDETVHELEVRTRPGQG